MIDTGDNLKDVIEKIFKIANNVLYFNDNSDYETVLYEICSLIKPDEEAGLKFIE